MVANDFDDVFASVTLFETKEQDVASASAKQFQTVYVQEAGNR